MTATLPAPPDVVAAAAAVRARGYAVVPGALSGDAVAGLADALEEMRCEDERRFGADYLRRIGQEGFVINVGNRHPAFTELLRTRPCQDLVSEVLGEPGVLYLFQGVVVPPGGGLGAYPWKWHCDLYYAVEEVADPHFLPGLNCLMFLDDVDSGNGGTWLLPGSQGLPASKVPVGDEEFLRAAGRQVEAAAGSALVFNPLLWHCAGANTTGRARRAVKMLVVRRWMQSQMDYSRSLRPAVLAGLDAEGRRLAGVDSRSARCFEELASPEHAAQMWEWTDPAWIKSVGGER